jgi:N-acetylglucosaminyldiphosphoundecaprenol N-acetyl-beta-D-mannosaminyltransferase
LIYDLFDKPYNLGNTMLPVNKVNILGVGINALTIDSTVNFIQSCINKSESQYICVIPAHTIMQGYRQPHFRKIINLSGLSTPDGMGVVWLLRLKGYKNVERVYGPDLMNAICRNSVETNWRHYFYGGEPGVPERLAEKLINKYPNLSIAGMYSPPFRDLTIEEDKNIINRINETHPDIVWVGIGSPKQEIWMYEHIDKINNSVLIGVGAAFDFLSGSKPQAPLWIQRYGLEWIFRLASEPRRLWRRYIQYPLFGILVIAQILRIKQFPQE